MGKPPSPPVRIDLRRLEPLRRITLEAPAYPRGVRDLAEPPEIIHLAGAPLDTSTPCVAVVGTRDATSRGLDLTRDIVEACVADGWTIASGGAAGIDTAAHAWGLAHGGRTVVVLPAGPPWVVPGTHRVFFEEVARSGRGTLLWTMPDDARAQRPQYFPRNGALVALSQAVVVVEADVRSGARNAAAWARRLGRPVFAVPGAPGEKKSAGCLVEIGLGAKMLHDVGAFPAVLREAVQAAPPPVRRAPRRRQLRLDLEIPKDPDSMAVWEQLAKGPTHADDLAEATGLTASRIATALLTLALEDVVVEGPSGCYRRAKAT